MIGADGGMNDRDKVLYRWEELQGTYVSTGYIKFAIQDSTPPAEKQHPVVSFLGSNTFITGVFPVSYTHRTWLHVRPATATATASFRNHTHAETSYTEYNSYSREDFESTCSPAHPHNFASEYSRS